MSVSVTHLLIICRVMVAISMPAAGFFLFMITEGSAQMMITAGRGGNLLHHQVGRDSTAINVARREGARLAQESFQGAMGWYLATAGTGFFTSSALCFLAMKAGRRVKNLIQ